MAPKTKCVINGTSSTLPDHIIHDLILPRLPFKTLNRFKCTSKACYDLISRDLFFASLQSRQSSPSSFGLVYQGKNGLSFLPDPKATGVCDSSLNFVEDSLGSDNIKLISSTSGLLLLYLHGDVNSLCVCNPATKEKQLVPDGEREKCFLDMGLAFDPVKSPDRYVVVNPSSHHELGHQFDVFRSDTGTWVRSSEVVRANSNSNVYRAKMPVYAKGILYWECCYYLLLYNVDRDKAGFILIPKNMSSSIGTLDIGVCEDQITCCNTSREGVEVWRLIGTTQWERPYQISWDELLKKNPMMDLSHVMKLRGKKKSENFYTRCNVKPLGFDGRCMYLAVQLRHGNWYNCVKDGKVFICDMVTGMPFDIGINFSPILRNDRVFSYHNNMASVPPIFKSRNLETD